jgi:hypothetical protein
MSFIHAQGSVNLQATLAAITADGTPPTIRPHHPITCQGALEFGEDNCLSCPHAETEADDGRIAAALRHTVAIMIIEEAVRCL